MVTDSALTQFNDICINRVASTILSLLNLPKGDRMAPPIEKVLNTASDKFSGEKCDRVFMYNPDAIAYWIYHKYQSKFFTGTDSESDLVLPMLSVFPPVTPACFGSMYSGLLPPEHGIQSYTKPVLKCQTLFDRLIEEGKKVAIVSTSGDSISLIFLERKMDYFIYKSVAECNRKAEELIKEDKYDVIILYNTNYDYWMHRSSPTGLPALHALKSNTKEYLTLKELITTEWKFKHKTALAFAPDHGCHRWLGLLGNHGINEPCDMNTVHFWTFI